MTMKNIPSKKGWMTELNHPHIEPPPITLNKEKHNGKSENDFVKLKLRRDPMLCLSDLYEFKISFFENDEPDKFLLFIRNFNMTLAASGTL